MSRLEAGGPEEHKRLITSVDIVKNHSYCWRRQGLTLVATGGNGERAPPDQAFPQPIQRLVGRFPRFWGTVTPRPRIWYPGAQLLEGIDRRDAGGRHRGRVGSCRLRPEGDSEARPARGR